MHKSGKEVIVIGGGIGGLVTGCLLSKEGFRVTVLDRHYRIGGGLHCFDRYGVTWESGIHYISGFEENGVLYKLCKYLGIYDQISLMPLEPKGFDILHVGEDNAKYAFGVGRENFVDQLAVSFPGERDNIRRYVDGIYEICNSISLYNLRVSGPSLGHFREEFLAPVTEFIAQFTQNEKLRNVLAYNNSLYGGDKEMTPIYIHALVNKFYIEGATRFTGGSQQFADAMSKFITDNGGEIHLSTEVTRLEVHEKKVTKVIASNGNEFSADYYISGIHPGDLMAMIDPEKIQRSYRERLQGLENSYSAFITFVAFKPNTFPFLNHNYYYFKDYNKIWDLINYKAGEYPPGFMLLTPPMVNQGEFADHALISCVMKWDDVKQWENTTLGKRGESYEAFKQQMEDSLLDLAETVFPTIRQSASKIFSSSPLTIRDYLGSKYGSLYGYKKDCRNIVKTQIMPRTKLENLLLTGQNINLHGIIGVPLSSIVTAGELVGQDYLISKINNHQK